MVGSLHGGGAVIVQGRSGIAVGSRHFNAAGALALTPGRVSLTPLAGVFRLARKASLFLRFTGASHPHPLPLLLFSR